MKSILQFLLFFCCYFVFAQEEVQVKNKPTIKDSTSLQNKTKEVVIQKTDKKKKQSLNSTNTIEKSIANINTEKEINAILNYKVRVWRENLDCLVCLKDLKSSRMA